MSSKLICFNNNLIPVNSEAHLTNSNSLQRGRVQYVEKKQNKKKQIATEKDFVRVTVKAMKDRKCSRNLEINNILIKKTIDSCA